MTGSAGGGIDVTELGGGAWKVRAERALANDRAAGEAVVRAAGAREAAVHGRLAAARAWRALGERLLERDAPQDAAEAARRGLDELGEAYAPAGTKDDTTLKRMAGEDLLAGGRAGDGARLLLRVLGDRESLYRDRHPEAAA
jgi:hypothetical protein